MGMKLHRVYEIKNPITNKWEMVNIFSNYDLSRFHDSVEIVHDINGVRVTDRNELTSDIGWSDTYFSNDCADENKYIYNRGLPNDISDELKERIQKLEAVESEYGRAFSVSFVSMDELLDLYQQQHDSLMKEVSKALSYESYSFFNGKIDRLLVWAATDKKPKITKKEQKTIDYGYFDCGWAEHHVSELLDALNPILLEINRMRTIAELCGDKYCRENNLREIFYYTMN